MMSKNKQQLKDRTYNEVFFHPKLTAMETK